MVARGKPPSAEYNVDRLLSDVVVDPPVLAESRYRKSAREPRPPREMATRFPFVVEEWNATGGRALLRLLCPRHCVGRFFSDHTLASDAHLHTCGTGTRGFDHCAPIRASMAWTGTASPLMGVNDSPAGVE